MWRKMLTADMIRTALQSMKMPGHKISSQWGLQLQKRVDAGRWITASVANPSWGLRWWVKGWANGHDLDAGLSLATCSII